MAVFGCGRGVSALHGGNVWAAARQHGGEPAKWLDFSASINPLGPPPWVLQAVRRAVEDLTRYPDPDCTDLVAAAVARHALDPACIIFGNGAAELIHLLVAALAPPAALVLAPTFGRYAAALRLAGVRVTELPAWPRPPAAEVLVRWVEGAPDGALIFFCNPNNPTGQLLPVALVQAALAQARLPVVVDEAYLDFVPGTESLLCRMGTHPNLVVLRSLTKLYALPGLRLGWLAGPPRLVARLRGLQPPWSVNVVAAAAGVAALTGPDYAEPTRRGVAAARADIQGRLARLSPGLQPLRADANYFLVRLRGITGSVLQQGLLAQRILVRTCTDFSRLGDGYLRLAVRPRPEADRLLAALEQVLP